jgi:hypothetical protein
LNEFRQQITNLDHALDVEALQRKADAEDDDRRRDDDEVSKRRRMRDSLVLSAPHTETERQRDRETQREIHTHTHIYTHMYTHAHPHYLCLCGWVGGGASGLTGASLALS